MILQDVIERLQLRVLTNATAFNQVHIYQGYVSDMLSCVVAGAPNGCVWVTLLAHSNIVAVATLLEIPAIIITEGAQPDETTLARANEMQIALLSTPLPSFEVVGRLWQMGIRANNRMSEFL
ncbi:MAG TPA: serine kinase [Anaerolineaceae bacterium]|nr:MAG: hypothetical protein XD89_0615 [Anaerolineae bacterium 49_20]HAE86213.1 serine kinase [Anaerolineaceae bacterium]